MTPLYFDKEKREKKSRKKNLSESNYHAIVYACNTNRKSTTRRLQCHLRKVAFGYRMTLHMETSLFFLIIFISIKRSNCPMKICLLKKQFENAKKLHRCKFNIFFLRVI